jgi:hypothetical protein
MTAPAPYVIAIRASDLFADHTYQRDVDPKRVRKMADDFDPRLLGVIDVSARMGGRYAILDGQHRHALIIEARGADTPVVCQVYEGLTLDDEARLFHEINVRRKALNFWDRWKARRASGDERVQLIEAVLANHGLKVNPAPGDGNVIATAALELIVDEIGDHYLLDSVIVILLSSFGRSRDAFQGPILQALAYVLANYPPAELDRDRLVQQLSEVPVRQLRARAGGLREMHKGTTARLVGEVIVSQYNRGAGARRVESFLTRVPAGSAPTIRKRWREQSDTTPAPSPSTVPAGCDTAGPVEAPPRRAIPPAAAAGPGLCECSHSRRLHEDGDGMCLAGCRCPSFIASLIGFVD